MGEKLQLTAKLIPENAEGSIKWESMNKKVAKVTQKGVVKPVKVGKAKIKATATKNANAWVTIEVTVKKSDAPTSISVGTSKKSLYVGEQWWINYKLSPADAKTTLTFSSSDEAVATVDGNGLITALSVGSSTITVKTHNNKKASCKITVLPIPTIQLDRTSVTLKVGETYSLTCLVTGEVKDSIQFSSSDETVAIVDSSGVITAVGPGSGIITAKISNASSASCEVTVESGDVAIFSGDLSIFLGKSISEIRAALNDPFDKVVMSKYLYGESEPPFTAYGGNNGVKVCVWEKDMNIDSVKLDANTRADYNIFGVNVNNTFEEVRQTLGCKGVSEVVTEWGSVYDPIIEDYYFDDRKKMIIVDYKQKTMYLVEGFWEQVKCIEYY